MSIWWQLILGLAGGGIMTQGIVGLAMNGNLPGIEVPESVRPIAKFVHIVSMFVGITLLLHYGTHDLVSQIVAQLF